MVALVTTISTTQQNVAHAIAIVCFGVEDCDSYRQWFIKQVTMVFLLKRSIAQHNSVGIHGWLVVVGSACDAIRSRVTRDPCDRNVIISYSMVLTTVQQLPLLQRT